MQDFVKLLVWQKAHQLTISVYEVTNSVYEVTKNFPQEERYSLTSQIRRASSSIPANIAEGCGKEGNAEFGRFLQIAQGSASELEYHLLLSRDLEYLSTQDYEILAKQANGVRRMLTMLIKRVKAE